MAAKQPKLVVLGGGTGMPVLLQGLKKHPVDLTAVVAVSDDGGSTGAIRETIDIPAPGDIRNVIAALSNVDEDLYELFQYRIEGENGLAGHALGNLLLVATNEITRDFNQAVNKIARLFNVQARILPIVNQPVTLHAEMLDGTIVSGESNIPIENKEIKRVFLTPADVQANREVVEAILAADLIVISPGSLFTSILPNLIIKDVIQALKETDASIVYVCNLMTQVGETDGFTASQHIDTIHDHLNVEVIDTIIVHKGPIQADLLAAYEREGSYQVDVDLDELMKRNIQVIEANMTDIRQDVVRHNYKELANILTDLAEKS